jgi:alanyl-tRNA synthetase
MAAIAAGDQCAAAIESAAKLDGDALEREVSTLNAQLDGLTMSVARKAALRKRLTEVQNKAKGQRKERERERAKLAAGRAAQIADAALMNGDEVIVDTIEVGSDRSALQQALKTIQTKAPRAAVMLLSPDADAERVAILAGVPDAIVKRGLDASAWVRHAAEACGGKGGGKPTSAQGSGTDVGKLGDALKVARREAFRVLA